MKIVNRTVPEALRRLDYTVEETATIIAHIEKFDTIEDIDEGGQPVRSGLKPEHLHVFDCAFKPYRGKRSIAYMAHLKMMAAAQPFISGAISKTVNMPGDSTVADIRDGQPNFKWRSLYERKMIGFDLRFLASWPIRSMRIGRTRFISTPYTDSRAQPRAGQPRMPKKPSSPAAI